MLLLYILWDDWPIFMISGSNQQLQQELEYTLLNPDYHSWWISKMQSDTLEESYAIKSGFSRVYSSSCCRCSFEPEIIKIGQLSYKMYSNNILNFQLCTTILNPCTKNVWKLIEFPTYMYKQDLALNMLQ